MAGTEDVCALDMTCRNTNREIQKALEDGLRSYSSHSEIRTENPSLYRDDRVHLSVAGILLFLRDLQQGLREVLGL